MSGSNTRRSLKYLRDQGFVVDITERWISAPGMPGGGVRKDLFTFGDLFAVGPPLSGVVRDKVIVQTTSYGEVSKRVKKIRAAEAFPAVIEAGIRVEVHGWRKVKGRWRPRVVGVGL